MLTYKAKRSFIITVNLGHNSYEFQRCNNKDSVKRKYKGMELYSLPLALFRLNHWVYLTNVTLIVDTIPS